MKKKALSIKPTFLPKRNDYHLRISAIYNTNQFHKTCLIIIAPVLIFKGMLNDAPELKSDSFVCWICC